MFKINPEPTFTHTVKVKVPVDGGFTEQSCKATFKVVPTYESAKFNFAVGSDVTEFLLKVVVSLDDIVDANDAPVMFNDAVRDQLLGIPYLRHALTSAYFAGVSGAREGN